jgi:hypothetical protein
VTATSEAPALPTIEASVDPEPANTTKSDILNRLWGAAVDDSVGVALVDVGVSLDRGGSVTAVAARAEAEATDDAGASSELTCE